MREVSQRDGEGGTFTSRWISTKPNAPTALIVATALAELCEIYWPPLYGYLRNRGHRPEEAQDLTQGFFARLLETHAIRSADPERGRFRAFFAHGAQALCHKRVCAKCLSGTDRMRLQ